MASEVFAGNATMRAGESYPHIFSFVGASSISATDTLIYKNATDVSAVATGITPATILSGSTSSSGVTVTSDVVTIPTTGYFGAILTLVILGTVDGKLLRIWLEIHIPSFPKA